MAKVYANIIDNILDEPDLTGGGNLGEERSRGDQFLDLSHDEADTAFLNGIAGESDHTSIPGGSAVTASHSNWQQRATHAMETGILAEAAAVLAAKTPTPVRFASLKQASQAGTIVLAKSKTGSGNKSREALKQATDLLQRVLAKTREQMEADGAKTANDYANAEIVPGWAKHVRAAVRTIEAAFGAYLPHANAKVRARFAAGMSAQATPVDTTTDDRAIPDRALSDAEARNHLERLLNSGESPKSILHKIEKMAELQLVNQSMATEFLRNNAGLLGYAYIKPDQFMQSCEATKGRMASVKAHSVMRIKACTGCAHHKQAGQGSRCNLYKLPVVASKKDLFPIINNLTPGVPEKGKRAALIAQANKDNSRVDLAPKQANVRRTVRNDYALGSKQAKTAMRKSASATTFTVADAATMFRNQASVTDIYKFALQRVGTVKANEVIKKLVKGLKAAKASVNLVQIDCKPLRGKLATANAIVGAKKCGSCTYRQGMHCGLTGGTLVTFPGMEKAASNHKIASGAPKDGIKMVESWGLTKTAAADDIDISGPKYDDVDFSGGGINL